MNLKEPKQIGAVIVVESMIVADGAGATMIPALFFPTDGAS